MAKEKIDIQKFLSDPAFTEERDFLRGVFDAFKQQDAETAEKKKKESGGDKSILQRLFDGE